MWHYLVTKKFQESKKENWENKKWRYVWLPRNSKKVKKENWKYKKIGKFDSCNVFDCQESSIQVDKVTTSWVQFHTWRFKNNFL